MKLFVYEYITGGALINESLPASLAREGDSMLQAIINDFLELDTVDIIILRDHRLARVINQARLHCHIINSEASFQQAYRSAMNNADFILVIAPETDNVLADLLQETHNNNIISLGCQPFATRLCSDKYICYQQLNNFNIDTVSSTLASDWLHIKGEPSSAYIVKPRDGAGCIDTLFFANELDLSQWLVSSSAILSQLIIQPYISGLAISLSILYSKSELIILAINQQHINNDGDLIHFEGNTVNGINEQLFSLTQARDIATQVQQAIDGLWGFVGIDLILTNNSATIVDINPRITTSYIGLHQSLELNPAQLLINIIDNNHLVSETTLQRHPIKVRV